MFEGGHVLLYFVHGLTRHAGNPLLDGLLLLNVGPVKSQKHCGNRNALWILSLVVIKIVVTEASKKGFHFIKL